MQDRAWSRSPAALCAPFMVPDERPPTLHLVALDKDALYWMDEAIGLYAFCLHVFRPAAIRQSSASLAIPPTWTHWVASSVRLGVSSTTSVLALSASFA